MRSHELWLLVLLGGCGTASSASAPTSTNAPPELCAGGEVAAGAWAELARALDAHVCYAGDDGLAARLWRASVEPTLTPIDAFAARAGWVAHDDWIEDETGAATRSYVDGARALTIELREGSSSALYLNVTVVEPASLAPAPPPEPPEAPGPDCGDVPRPEESFAQFEARCPS